MAEKIGLQLKNPCKYCLVKPACSRKCELLKKHIETFEVSTGCGVILGHVLFVIALCIYSYINWSKTLTWIGISIYYIVHYGFVLYHHLKNPSELNEMERWERWIILTIFPYAFLPVGFWFFIQHHYIDKPGYFYRYHKTLNPTQEF